MAHLGLQTSEGGLNRSEFHQRLNHDISNPKQPFQAEKCLLLGIGVA